MGAEQAAPAASTPARARVRLRHACIELLLTFLLLFSVATVTRWVIGASPISRALPGIHLKLLVIGTVIGLLLVLLILSPPGKASGGHVNPGITVAMWRFGVFPGRFVLPYIAAQLAGSLLGALTAGAVWGAPATRRPVAYAVLQPGPGWSAWSLMAAETTTMALLVLAVGFFLAVPRLTRYVPWLVGCLVGLIIVLLGTTTGGSANPARQFGPAVLSGQTDWLWVYLTAPVVGAVLAAGLRHAIQPRQHVSTHALCGPDRLPGSHPARRPVAASPGAAEGQ